MSKSIMVRDEIYSELKELKMQSRSSFSDVIFTLLEENRQNKELLVQKVINNLMGNVLQNASLLADKIIFEQTNTEAKQKDNVKQIDAGI